MTPQPDEQVRKALKRIGRSVTPAPDATEQFAARLRAEHRVRRVLAVVVTAIVVVFAVVVPVVATRNSAGDGVPPAGDGAPAEFAAVTGSGDAVVVNSGNGHVVGAPLALHALAIAAIPGGGWVLAERAGANQTTLEAIGVPNAFVLKRSLVGLATAIDVSPDARKVAIVLTDGANGNRQYLQTIDPYAGLSTSVDVPTTGIRISGVSWAENSTRMYVSIEDRRPAIPAGGVIPFEPSLRPSTNSPVPGNLDLSDVQEHLTRNRGCDVVRGFALGLSGDSAVLGQCSDSPGRLTILTTLAQGSGTQPGVVVPPRPGPTFPPLAAEIKAAEITGISVSSDGAHILLSTETATWRIEGRQVRRLAGRYLSPSWTRPALAPSSHPTASAEPTTTPTSPDAGSSEPPIGTPPAVPGYSVVAGLASPPGGVSYLTGKEMDIFSATTGQRVGNVKVDNAEAVAQLPTGGWVVAQLAQDKQRTILINVQPNGIEHSLSAEFPGLVLELAVSPDGTRAAAIGYTSTAPDYSNFAGYRLEIVNLSTGVPAMWPLADTQGNTPTYLSWSPNSRYLTFNGYGGGAHGGLPKGGYEQIDTSAPPGPVERAAGPDTFLLGHTACTVENGFWLGNTGEFAAVGYCSPSGAGEVLVTVPYSPAPASGVPAARLITALPGFEGSATISVTADGRHLRLSSIGPQYEIDDRQATRVNQTFGAATW